VSPSHVVRVYLPVDARQLRELHEQARITGPSPAFAVTPRLARAAAGADTEELEYAAAAHAAAQRGLARVRRVVIAADLPAAVVVEPIDPLAVPLARVRVLEPLLRRQVAAFQVDELPGGSCDDDLMWYDATELDTVRELAE
jgi:hypothetical protein